MKGVDLGEPTSFLDHVYLGCTQRECAISREIVTKYRDMLESRISAGAKEKLHTEASGKTDAEIIELCSNQGFLPGLKKNCQQRTPWRNLMPKRYLHGLMIWLVMQRNVWKDIANLRIKPFNNYI